MKKRGQTSIEFLIFIGIASLMFLTFLIIALSYLTGVTKNKEITEAEDISRMIRNEINLASWVKGNYERIIQLPETIGGKTYTLKISNRELTLVNENNVEFTQMLATQVYKDLATQDPVLLTNANGFYIIKKENDKITIFKK